MTPMHRWVGGKRRLAYTIRALMPPCRGKHIEPFLGGGAVLWQRLAAGEATVALAGDVNPHLINLWDQLALRPVELHQALSALPRGMSEYRRNQRRLNELPAHGPESAALTLWLLAAGFNGLWRVNRAGQHNVPPGDQAVVRLPGEQELLARSRLLGRAYFACCDFEDLLERAVPGDQVYADPPYLPGEGASTFTSYSAGGFGFEQHERLVKALAELAQRGVLCVASGRWTAEAMDLYRSTGARVYTAAQLHCVGASGDSRGQVGEILAVWR